MPIDLARGGTRVGEIDVSISYNIINLFSGHLYSNPAKAIEELAVNSYDAFAQHCQIVVPNDWDAPNAKIVVWDDGESMDLAGLRELWLVADTHKRDDMYTEKATKNGRLPVGKFGIGKLASYVVGKRITHVCKRDRILAVTMDYSKVIPEDADSSVTPINEDLVKLDVRELSPKDAESMLEFATSGELPGEVRLPLFGRDSPKNWTLVVVDQLKPEARRIVRGRLHWIISTALPLVPDFEVSLNGELVPPSRLTQKVLKRWQIGKDDKIALDQGYSIGKDEEKEQPFDCWITIPQVGPVSGEFTLYEETLLGRKAGDTGRSHGFFLMVRHRLINHDDPLLGIHALSHQTFNRMRAVINADDLDTVLVASRESISEVSRDALENYLSAKFYEVRKWYEDHLIESAKDEAVAERLASVPSSLTSIPLKHAVDIAARDEASTANFQAAPSGRQSIWSIRGFELASLDPDYSIAMFDAATGIVKINVNHPYYLNYSEFPGMDAFAASEVLLEAYLYETSLGPSEVRELMKKRDDLLRALVRERPRSVVLIAQQLLDSVDSQKDLENSCHRAFSALGYEVIPLATSKEPDGLATAILAAGPSKKKGGAEQRSYKITYDAKSTSHDKVSSGDLRLSRVTRHRRKYGAQYAAVIGVDFPTDRDGEESSAVKEALQQGVSLIRAKDFASLIEASGIKPIDLAKLEELFRDCRSPEDVHIWVKKFKAERKTFPELRKMLDRTYSLQKKKPLDPPSFGAIKYSGGDLGPSEAQIKEWMTAFSRLEPEYVKVYGEKVELRQTPEIIVNHFQKLLRQISKKT